MMMIKRLLFLSADNPFSVDGMETTEERLKHYGLESEKIRVLHFPDRDEYVSWMRAGDVYLSCSRSEGWNLPLSEAIASGTPSICSNWSGQLEFAQDISLLVDIKEYKAPEKVFMLGDEHDYGVWAEPDFDHLKYQMTKMYDHYHDHYRELALKYSNLFRKVWTWDNAARMAEDHIDELLAQKSFQVPSEIEDIDKGVKLNLGCGNEILDGYINIDRYNNTGNVDLSCDLGALPFPDGSVDEIYTSHVFEHIEINDIYGVMSEWRRVLRDKGRLKMYLPNLEHEVRVWLDTPDDRKWFEVHRIFGSQSHPGNTHFSGHNPASLKSFLESF
jgi:SAM-dependent methyltransferase